MEKLKDKLSTVGAFLSAAGILSSLLAIFNYEVRILAWINLWGVGVAWAIRLGLILGGAAIFKIFKPAEAAAEAMVAPVKPAIEWDAYYRSLLADPAFSRFLAKVREQHAITFQAIADIQMYRVSHLQLSNTLGKVVPPGAQDIYLANAYLDRNGERLLVGAVWRDGRWESPLVKPLSPAEWAAYVPADTSPDHISTAAKMATA